MLRSTRVIGKPGSSHAAQKKAGSGRPCSQTRIQARSDRRPGDQNRAAVQQARYTGQALPEPRQSHPSMSLRGKWLKWHDLNIKMKGMAVLQTAAEAAVIEIITAAEKLANHRGANSVCRVDLVQLRQLADGMSASALQLLQCAADRHHVIELYQAKFAVMHRAPSSRRQRVLKQRKFLSGLQKQPRTPRIAKNPAPKKRCAKKR